MNRTGLLLVFGLVACGSGSADTGGGGSGSTSRGAGGATSSASASATTGTAGGACSGLDTSTASIDCNIDHSALNSDPSVNTNSTVAWSCSTTTRSMTSNGIPDHAVGTFPNANCPNTISAQAESAAMTLTPAETGTAAPVGIVGYAVNGVKFDPSTAGSCTVAGATTTCSLIGNTGQWNIEALGQSSFNFGVDASNAHVQPTGAYHYHGMPEAVLAKLGQGAMAPTLVGFALDGFAVYARYGYTDAMDPTSAVKVMKGSYQLKATPDSGRPSTATYPMGAFTQDYEYAAGSGDLDECNGRVGVTPEFPCGIYHYYITDTYPFIQRCVKGTPMGGSGNPPMCGPSQPAPCCGDGVCGGPETPTNCPVDCP